MKTKIIIVNGAPRVGKDEIVRIASKILNMNVQLWSSVDNVKVVAQLLGWNGIKDPKGRRFLSDLKDLSTINYNGPFNVLCERVKQLDKTEDHLLFAMVREPSEIKKIKDHFGERVTTLLITRYTNEEISCHADMNVSNYEYDYTVNNNGTFEDLENNMRKLLINEELGEYLI